jgi:type IV secretion system protein VirB9
MKYYNKILVILFSFFIINVATADLKVDSRVKTFIYDQNDIYKIVMHTGFQTNFEFGINEQIETISFGDSDGMTVNPVGRRVIIKPHIENIHTNMTIITNKRVYNFELFSKNPTPKKDEQLAYVVRFFYPKV